MLGSPAVQDLDRGVEVALGRHGVEGLQVGLGVGRRLEQARVGRSPGALLQSGLEDGV